MRLFVWIQSVVGLLQARLDQRGQSTLEYVGMIAVAAFLVVGVLSAVGAVDLPQFFTDKVEEVKTTEP